MGTPPFRYNSSMRARSIAETLTHARVIAAQLGITRVTDTTRLDRAGIPVFASIRPGAQIGSLCVNAGKGLSLEEAQIGAYMESIELAYAEPGRAALNLRRATGREVAATGYPLADFGLRTDVTLDEDRAINCTEAEDVTNARRCLVPAERVLFPSPTTFFTSDTNGLASGNTLLEATVHGLAEVIERDIASFAHVRPRSRRVRNETLPGPLAEIAARVEPLGLELVVRATENDFEMPFFTAVVREPAVVDAVHSGYGCHPWSAIAATRAICEAFQCRLTIIHGGRDSLLRNQESYIKAPERHATKDAYAEANARDPNPIDFADVRDWSAATPSLEELYSLLERQVVPISGGVLRVPLTPAELPIQVVKVIVPRLEFFTFDRLYAGPRLRAAQGLGVNSPRISNSD